MVMGGRRVRRSGRGHSLLPLSSRHHRYHNHHNHHPANTISCWYCDFKFSSLNDPLFYFGQKHARCLRAWFTIGIGFSLTALVVVSLILLWESARPLKLYGGSSEPKNLLNRLLFGFSPSLPGLSISVIDAGLMVFSTLISVVVHEFGHAAAAARSVSGCISFSSKDGTTSIESSEGIRVEYIAIFLAIIFPGALVAFNYEVVQSLPHSSLLRIYCAGIWHNAVSCAVCGLALIFLPLILFPLYIHGESPMVLGLSSTSPLFGYLSPGDSIVSLDGIRIHDPHEWMKMITLIDEQTHQSSNYSDDARSVLTLGGRKGYCVPSSLLDKSVKIQLEDSQFACPDELSAFVKFPCFNSSLLDNGYHENGKWGANCLTAKHVVKLKKCGDGWPAAVTSSSSCECSQDQSCLMPAQVPGVTWVEIAYSNPYSLECLQKGENSSADIEGTESVITNCGGTFVFIGDAHSMGHSVQLTAYQPRWALFLGAYLPNSLEKILVCTFHVSLTLAFLNSLPVFFLDGESILEVIVCNITFLSARKRENFFQICLLGGTLFSILAISRISLSIFL